MRPTDSFPSDRATMWLQSFYVSNFIRALNQTMTDLDFLMRMLTLVGDTELNWQKFTSIRRVAAAVVQWTFRQVLILKNACNSRIISTSSKNQQTPYQHKSFSPFISRLYGAEYGWRLKSPPSITGKFVLSSIFDILSSSASRIWIWASRMSCLFGL